jgi:4-diphosphocytidyl-2-C-methyl-D-erythritol kinase
MILPSPAKVNHFLHITGKRIDGYHNLQTLFQYIDWCDYLSFEKNNSTEINLILDGPTPCPNDDNIVIKAAKKLQEISPSSTGINITLTKNLPSGAGLGGGSSNAATALYGLNKLWNNLSLEKLKHLGCSLGADVPFFLHGVSALGEGIGEKLTSMTLHENWMLIAIPNCCVSTKLMFADKDLTTDTPTFRICNQDALLATNSNEVDTTFKNDFFKLVYKKYPEVKLAYKWLSSHANAKLSGSGACIFACFNTKIQAEYVAERAPEGLKVIVTKGLNKSPLFSASRIELQNNLVLCQ